jgi:hypothetical protein
VGMAESDDEEDTPIPNKPYPSIASQFPLLWPIQVAETRIFEIPCTSFQSIMAAKRGHRFRGTAGRNPRTQP